MFKLKIDKIYKLISKLENDINSPIISDFLEWFYEKINLNFNKKTPDLILNIGDIYEIELGVNIGSELNKKRPCVIISKAVFNRGNTVIACPLKSIKKSSRLGKISLIIDEKNTGLKNKSYVSLFNIKEISKKRIGERIGKLNKKDIQNIKNSLKIIFNINEKKEKPGNKVFRSES